MAEYIKQEMNDIDGSGKERSYYRMKTYRNIDADEFVNKIAQPGSGLNEGSVKHVLGTMADGLAYYMAQGFTVTIGGLGTFKPTLSLKQDKEPDTLDGNDSKRNAQSIRVDGVNFRSSRDLTRKTDGYCTLQRGGTRRLQRSPYTAEQRLALALKYLDAHPLMRIPDYMQLTGLSRTSATRELQTFRRDSQSGITISGRGGAKVYIKSNPKT